ncbi:sensor histidine kinase [Tichowtungia aerotolerans]|uniref:Histidine kinase domain-containing protein n=1 Tax=Tichowtungia aerotolerans TaxID=2697043 RepID=A0A6P1M0B9_9BACT|nr:histidine kinase [Tichowtungia aerotolerans]QHI68000.1 hypothetical protein GT409_00555 [Tichowtungia aerotolerans]
MLKFASIFRVAVLAHTSLWVMSAELFAQGDPVGSVPLFSIKKYIQRLEVEEFRLRAELADLPKIDDSLQLDAYGYHSGYLPVLDELPEEPRWTVELKTTLEHSFNEFFLIPAADRRFDDMPGYGFPRRFRITAVAQDGSREVIADWRERDYPDPGRYPVRFAGTGGSLDTILLEVYRGTVEGGREFFALDEALIRTDFFVMKTLAIRSSASFESPPFWSADYLIDQKTSCGLPVGAAVGGEPLSDYIMRYRKQPAEQVLLLDLGRKVHVSMISLYPARPPEGIIVPGYGFPGSVRLQMFRDRPNDPQEIERVVEESALPNPGNNVVRISGNSRFVRWVQLTFSDFPVHEGMYTFALGEVALQGVELLQCRVASWDGQGQVDALVDRTANGLLVLPMNQWVNGLIRRNMLERRLNDIARLMVESVEHRRRILKTAWIVIGALIASLVIAALIYQHILRRVGALRLKQRITRDLHDEVGSNLGGMALMASALERTAASGEMKEELGELALMARDACASLREVVWLIDRSGVRLPDLLVKLRERTERVLDGMELTFEMPDDCPDVEIPLTLKRHLLMYFKEALHNCARHAQATKVDVSVQVAPAGFRLQMRDNGCGFDVSSVVDGWGLDSMRKRAQEMGGKMDLETAPGQGTVLVLTIPWKILLNKTDHPYKTSNRPGRFGCRKKDEA